MRRAAESDRHRRRWGQNFLVNEGAADAMVRAFLPRPGDHVLETIAGDILAIDPAELLDRLGATRDRPGRVIANLPYNIATAVILVAYAVVLIRRTRGH